MNIIQRLLHLLKPLWKKMLLSTAAGIVGFLCAIAIMSLGALLLADIAGYDVPLSRSMLLWLLFSCAVMRGILRYVEQYLGHDVAFRLLALLRERTFAALRRLAPAKTSNRHSADLNAALVADVELIEVFFAHTVAPILIAIGVSGVVLAVLASYGWVFPIITFGFYLLTLTASYMLSTRAGRGQGKAYRQAFAENSAQMLDNIYGLREILMFGRQRQSQQAIERASGKLSKALDRQRLLKSIVAAWPEAMITLAGIATFAVASYQELPIGDTLFLTVTVLSSFGPITALSLLTVDLGNTFAAAERIFAILDEAPAAGEAVTLQFEAVTSQAETETSQVEVEEGPQYAMGARTVFAKRDTIDRTKLPVLSGSAELERVSFRYPNTSQVILEKLSFTVAQGEKAALVGPSGCGKSTALRLLLRYYDCDEGQVIVGGENIRHVPLTALRNHVVLMAQHTFLFDDTIAANIKLGKPNATDEEMRTAARRAMIAPFIEQLPAGYDTRVGELGERLSGGERQRLGIARVLLSDAPVIVLDEPTSNLDALNEQGLLSLLRKELADRTVIMVSHRPAVVAWADTTMKLQHGSM